MRKKRKSGKKISAKRGVPSFSSLSPKKINKQFPIAALGGSAGGLEAFERFFRNMPPDSGMAFVIVAHQDPAHKGMLPELLRRTTRMKVTEAEDGMNVAPNTVYVIPSDKDLSLLHGKLQLFEPVKTRGVRMPIDFFFRSLAEDAGARAAGIILSGMGTDGTLGLRAIKEKMGMAIAQDPTTTTYDSMPLSAIGTGTADYVVPVEDMPEKLLGFQRNARLRTARELPHPGEKTANALQKIFVVLRAHIGHDFSRYKTNTVYRRIERRMEVNAIGNIADYVRYLQENPGEVTVLFKELLIGVTKFFRDPGAFETLKTKLISLLEHRPGDTPVRVWVPACSTGEEVYSIAIILKECFDAMHPEKGFKAQIFASDIDQESIDKARAGVYPANISADVSPDRLGRFFTAQDGAYRVKKEIRETVIFALQDMIKDPPFMKLDLLSCRNLLIYLTPELQKKLMPLFHYVLNPGGILFLGSAESIGEFADLFSPLDVKGRIYKRRDAPSPFSRIADISFAPVTREPGRTKQEAAPRKKADLSEINQKVLLDMYAPPSVIIDPKGDILFSNGHIGKYLELSPGKPVVNIFEMAKEGLQPELSGALYAAAARHKKVTREGLRVKANGGYETVNLTVQPLEEPPAEQGLLMVIFENVPPSKEGERQEKKRALPKKKSAAFKEQAGELKYTREQLRETRREMNTALEESKSINEELQSANEELQSTNEELMTSKEETQSLNEELVTLNNEYQEKIVELSQANNDMKNLLESTEIATIFLDNNLNIKRFTPQTNKIINLIPSDAGRPFKDIVLNLKYGRLADDIREVLAKLLSREIQVETNDHKWYMVRILPYRTIENVIDGVVITFMDITGLKELEKELQAQRRYAENIVNTVREPLVVLDARLRVLSANRSFYAAFKVAPGQVKGQLLYSLGNNEWDIPQLRRALHQVVDKNAVVTDFMVEHDFRDIGHKKMLLNARMVLNENNGADMILLAIEDVTDCEGRAR